MLKAFFESIKYVGHFFPIAFLRIFLGYYWMNQAININRMGLFSSQVFSEELQSSGYISTFPSWYQWAFEHLVYPYWSLFSHGFVAVIFSVGVSLILGFMVRAFSLVGIVICMHFVLWDQINYNVVHSVLTAVFITFILIGAGRCIGFDYFFYKRNRGLWW